MNACIHCGRPDPAIVQQLCASCAADATYNRTLFAEYRYLVPGERIVLGVETRSDLEAAEWRLAPALGDPVPDGFFGRFRRRLRLAGEAKRFVDLGEPVRETDERLEGEAVDTHHAFRRAMYATFPTSPCACPERVGIGGERTAEACVTCGRVWAVLEGSEEPEVTSTVLKPDCECKLVDPIGDLSKSRIRCRSCGRVWDQRAWYARGVAHPDMDLSKPQHALADVTSARQAEALQRTMLHYESARWQKLRAFAMDVFGEEAAKAIDKTFDDIRSLIRRRATGDREAVKEPLLLADTDVILKLVHDQLEHLDLHLQARIEEGVSKRYATLDAFLTEKGGEPCFERAAGSDDFDLNDATLEAVKSLAKLARPILKLYYQVPGDADTLLIQDDIGIADRLANLPGASLKDLHAKRETLPEDSRALLEKLCEGVVAYELDPFYNGAYLDVGLSPDIVEAVTPEPKKEKKHSETPTSVSYVVLPPDMEIRRGDYWEDVTPITGKAHRVRPCVSTIGKQVPWPPSLPREGETVEFGRKAVSPWRRPLDVPFPPEVTAPPDPYREHQMYLAFGGQEPDAEPFEAKADLTFEPKTATLDELEATLRTLYEAAGLKVLGFKLDEPSRIARLVLDIGGGTKIIDVPFLEDLS